MTRPAIRRNIFILAMIAALATVTTVSAHPHQVTKGNGEVVVIANGQNHPDFSDEPNEDGLYLSCEGKLEPEEHPSGPAGWGLETAHHGPDKGKPGKADGCYASDEYPAPDRNPAID